MCTRLIQSLDLNQLKTITKTSLVLNESQHSKSYNISPSASIPTIQYNTRRAEKSINYLKWGLSLPGVKFVSCVKCEELSDTTALSSVLNKSRCVVVVEGYFEWTERKEPWVFLPPKSQTPSCLYLAGLCIKDEYVVILIREATERLSDIVTRMPILLDKSEIDMWISSERNKFDDIIDRYILKDSAEKWDQLSFYRVAPFVNDPKNKNERCLMSMEQFKPGTQEESKQKAHQMEIKNPNVGDTSMQTAKEKGNSENLIIKKLARITEQSNKTDTKAEESKEVSMGNGKFEESKNSDEKIKKSRKETNFLAIFNSTSGGVKRNASDILFSQLSQELQKIKLNDQGKETKPRKIVTLAGIGSTA